MVAYLYAHPKAGWSEVIGASVKERQEVYTWLFKTSRKHRQDKRIRIMIELEAFQEIHRSWKRLGYPFDSLVPSLATALGSSADRPAALTELVGIILNEGMWHPSIRVESLRFAEQTPYETLFKRKAETSERVLDAEIAKLVKQELMGVVENGTGQRVKEAFKLADGTIIKVGGKTGTGDNRHELYGSGGRLIKSWVVNRTATFVFIIGDRFFGTITAYVAGSEAAQYKFTSALPVQVLKILAPKLMPLMETPSEQTEVKSAYQPRQDRLTQL
jgi:membrane peptidoglycan carboxypeptidase